MLWDGDGSTYLQPKFYCSKIFGFPNPKQPLAQSLAHPLVRVREQAELFKKRRGAGWLSHFNEWMEGRRPQGDKDASGVPIVYAGSPSRSAGSNGSPGTPGTPEAALAADLG